MHPNRARGGPRGGARGGRRGAPARKDSSEPGLSKLTQKTFLKFRLPSILLDLESLALLPVEKGQRYIDTSPLAAEFAAIGREVAQAKALLDGIPAKEYEALARAADLYAGLNRKLAVEGLEPSTNAARKIYEANIKLNLLECPGGATWRRRLFDNTALPGAFLGALVHYHCIRCPETPFEWVASSYLPDATAKGAPPDPGAESGELGVFSLPETATGPRSPESPRSPRSPRQAGKQRDDSTILGDTFGIYANFRENWLMGPRPNGLPEGEPCLSGDLTDPGVVAGLARAVHMRFKATRDQPSGATLYTSDAGVDVSEDYNRQEELTALLNYGQVICGLMSLAPGGNYLTKQYTFLTPFSRGLIGLIATVFEEAHVVKPLSSRGGNSEVYIHGRGFRGIPHSLGVALLGRLARYAEGLVPCDGPPLLDPAHTPGFAEVDAALLRVARQLHGGQQVAFLKEMAGFAARFRGCPGTLRDALRIPAKQAQELWLAENPVSRIRPGCGLVPSRAGRRADARPEGGAGTATPDGDENETADPLE